MPKAPSAELVYARKLAKGAKDTLKKAKALNVKTKKLKIKMDKTAAVGKAALARANKTAALGKAALVKSNAAVAKARKRAKRMKKALALKTGGKCHCKR